MSSRIELTLGRRLKIAKSCTWWAWWSHLKFKSISVLSSILHIVYGCLLSNMTGGILRSWVYWNGGNAWIAYHPAKKYRGAENKQPEKAAPPGKPIVYIDHNNFAKFMWGDLLTDSFSENETRHDYPCYHLHWYNYSDISSPRCREVSVCLRINNTVRNHVIICRRSVRKVVRQIRPRPVCYYLVVMV
jgi:hypothetical protein